MGPLSGGKQRRQDPEHPPPQVQVLPGADFLGYIHAFVLRLQLGHQLRDVLRRQAISGTIVTLENIETIENF